MKGRDQQGIITSLRIALMSSWTQITAYMLFIVVWPQGHVGKKQPLEKKDKPTSGYTRGNNPTIQEKIGS